MAERISGSGGRRTWSLRGVQARRTKPLRLPDFIAVGPPRTGTTWLDRVLRGRVGLPREVKETHFFVWNYGLGIDWYGKFFRECQAGIPLGEIAPTYFDKPAARDRIAGVISGCKIVCTLRDPTERVYSQYKTWHRAGLIKGPFDFDSQYPRLGAYGGYAPNIRAWQTAFGTDNVLIAIYEDLVADRQAYLDTVCEFIGIAPIDLGGSVWAERRAAASEESPRNPALARLGGRLRTWATRHPQLRLAHHLEAGAILWRFFFAGGPGYPPLDDETRRRLRERFRPDVEQLENLLGRDFSGWRAD